MKETMKRKADLLGLTISMVPLHAGWLYCLWACGNTKHSSKRTWLSRVVYLMATRKQKGATERYQDQDISFKTMPPATHFPQLGSTCHSSTMYQ